MIEPASRQTVIGAILAGGRGTRLGGIDKAFIVWHGEPLIRRVARRLAPHCTGIIVIANGDLGRFAAAGLDAIADRPDPAVEGARLGLMTAFDHFGREGTGNDGTGNHGASNLLLTTPTDLPDLPFDLVWRLRSAAAATGAIAASVASGERVHGLIALWTPAGAKRALAHMAANPGTSVRALHHALGSAIVNHPARPRDPFWNVNRPEDLHPENPAVAP